MSRVLFVSPAPRPASRETSYRFAPSKGWIDAPSTAAPLGSAVSAENCWLLPRGLQPRWRLSRLGNSILSDTPTGSFRYDDIEGVSYPVIASQDTIAYLDGDSWTTLAYVSGTSNLPMSGGPSDPLFGTSVFLERLGLNIGLFTNGVDPIFSWAGPSSGTGFSTLTQAPICADIALYDNSPIAWNIGDLSSSTRFVQRVQWPVATDPEDWTGIGSGFEDLVDMRGVGTRIFVEGDDLILGTDQQVWLGRRVGGPFRFQFDPLSRSVGIPYPHAAFQTPQGIFWLGDDYMVRRYANRGVAEVGGAIADTLRREAATLRLAFFGYNPLVRQLTLYYPVAGETSAQRAYTFDLDTQTWMPQRYAIGLSLALLVPQASSSGSTWGILTGTLGALTSTWAEMLGTAEPQTEGLLGSAGTAYSYVASAASDAGNAVSHSATLVLPSDAERRLTPTLTRLRLAADSASSLSVGWSSNGGHSVPFEQALNVSAASTVSFYDAFTSAALAEPALRLRSTGGDWRCTDVFVRGTLGARQ